MVSDPPPHLPKPAASDLIKGGAGEPEALPGAALLRPFYRLGAGEAGGPRCGWRAGRPAGQASRGSRKGSAGEAPPRRSWRRGAAARRAPFPRPPRVLGGASGGVPARPVSPAGRHRQLLGQARLATARGVAGGGRGEGGAGALPPLPPARGPEGSAARAAVRADWGAGEGRASAAPPPLRVTQPSAVGVGGRARRPGEGPGPAASLGDGVRERGSAAGRWPVAAAAAAETACFWKLWIDHSPREMEVLKIIGALIMQKKVKEMQRKTRQICSA